MLAVVAVDPVAVPSSEAERAVPALAAVHPPARGHSRLHRAHDRGDRPVDIHLLRDLLDEGAGAGRDGARRRRRSGGRVARRDRRRRRAAAAGRRAGRVTLRPAHRRMGDGRGSVERVG
jgi:hypothetical protein